MLRAPALALVVAFALAAPGAVADHGGSHARTWSGDLPIQVTSHTTGGCSGTASVHGESAHNGTLQVLVLTVASPCWSFAAAYAMSGDAEDGWGLHGVSPVLLGYGDSVGWLRPATCDGRPCHELSVLHSANLATGYTQAWVSGEIRLLAEVADAVDLDG